MITWGPDQTSEPFAATMNCGACGATERFSGKNRIAVATAIVMSQWEAIGDARFRDSGMLDGQCPSCTKTLLSALQTGAPHPSRSHAKGEVS